MTTQSSSRRLHFDNVDSTNAEALRQAANGERGPLWIDAERQTQGRGRSGRSWSSETGNLMSSFLFTTAAPADALSQLSLVSGVAVFDCVMAESRGAHEQLRLKWPNDILLGGAKAGGILIESTVLGATTSVAIGIGLNIASAPKLDGVATAALAGILVAPTGLHQIRQRLDQMMKTWLGTWDDGRGFAVVRTAWLDRGPEIGQPMSVRAGTKADNGLFAGLDQHGFLCLTRPDGTLQSYSFGDVSPPVDGGDR